jgi:hypothetical protein
MKAVQLLVSVVELDFHALAFQNAQAGRLGAALVFGCPEAGAACIDFIDHVFMQAPEGDDSRMK